MSTELRAHLRLASDLRRAVAWEEFMVHYQPVVLEITETVLVATTSTETDGVTALLSALRAEGVRIAGTAPSPTRWPSPARSWSWAAACACSRSPRRSRLASG